VASRDRTHSGSFEDKLVRFCVLHLDEPGPVGKLAFHVAFLYGQLALGKRMIETTARFQVFNHVTPTTKLKTCATLKSCGSQDRDVEIKIMSDVSSIEHLKKSGWLSICNSDVILYEIDLLPEWNICSTDITGG